MEQYLNIRIEGDAGIVRVSLVGELTGTEADAVDTAIDEALALTPRCIHLEMIEVTFVDSLGLAAILRARRRLADGQVVLMLVKPSRPVMRVLDATQLTDLFDILEAPTD